MSGLRGSARLVVLLILPMLVYALAGYAETNHSTDRNTSIRSSRTVSPEVEGDVLMARGMFAAALRSYLSEKNQTPVLLNKIGLAYHHLLAFDEACKYYQQALARNPNSAQVLNNLGAIYFERGEFGHAERLYRHALKYEPDHAIILANLGTTYFAENKFEQGTQAFQKAMALNPGVLHPDARIEVVEGKYTREQLAAKNYYLAKMFAASGSPLQAISYLQKALESGFHDRKKLMKESKFASLRSTPQFQQLVAEPSGLR